MQLYSTFYASLISLSTMTFNSSYVLSNGKIPSLYGCMVLCYVYVDFYFLSIHLCTFTFTIANSVALNMRVQMSVFHTGFISFMYIASSGAVRPCERSLFNFSWGIFILFSMMPVLLYISTTFVYVFFFLHVAPSTFLSFVFLFYAFCVLRDRVFL